MKSWDSQLEQFAGRRLAVIAVVGALALAYGLARGALRGVPVPFVQDEFCYLLTADTFASGRLTNPPHPLWKHFETMYINQQPTYAAKYFPAQGLMLAIGQRLFGHPILGVWISTALACAAICWMLQQWLSPLWALGASLLAMTALVTQYWNYGYFGGSLAALAGALLFGSVRRAEVELRVADGLRLGFALSLLANTRPFEGLLAAACAGAMLFSPATRQSRRQLGVFARRLVLPVLLLVIPTVLWIGFYNKTLTGDPLKSPYQLNQETHFPFPILLTGKVGVKPEFRHQPMERTFDKYYRQYIVARTPQGFIQESARRLVSLGRFYLGFSLVIPFAAALFLKRDCWTRYAVWSVTGTVVFLLFATWLLPHYIAPFTSLIYVIVAQGLRAISGWPWAGFPFRRIAWVAVVAAQLIALSGYLVFQPRYVALNQPWAVERQRIQEELERDPNNHVIIVRYSPAHNADHEWVYNRANIDRAKVVWARDMDEENGALLTYFHDRKAWILEADSQPPVLSAIN